MENFENELDQQPQLQSEPQPEPQPELETQPEAQPEAQPQPQPQQPWPQDVHGGASPASGNTSYPYYGCPPGYQQPWQPYQQPWQPYQQPQPQPPQPPIKQKQKQKRKGSKVWLAILCCILTLVIAIGSCAVTAAICINYCRQQNALVLQNLNEKFAALQKQIEDDKNQSAESGGILEPGQTLTAAEIYQQNVNSIVAITCTVRTTSYGQTYEATSSGTGFVITENGHIVTNHHVIDGASKITVTMADGTEYSAAIVGSNATNDVAVILIKAEGLRPVTLGTSSTLQVGDQVVAIGNALGELTASLTVGYVSGMDRDITTDGTVINMIQTDAAINSGNSGGPLFNAKGEVIGITSAKYSGTTSSGASIEGISFAIPLDDVIDMIEDLRDFGYIKSAYLGVMVWEVDATVAATYNFPKGVYVEEVTPGYCAEAAGVRAKDIIIELGGYTVQTMNDLSRALRNLEAGETVTIIVWRAGQEVIMEITLDEKPAT